MQKRTKKGGKNIDIKGGNNKNQSRKINQGRKNKSETEQN